MAMRIETLLQSGFFVAVYVEDHDGVPFEIKVELSASDMVRAFASGKRPIDLFVGQDVQKLIQNFEATEGLGSLSRKYESNGKAGAIGRDSTGGPSYGAYQFASFKGTVASFINFLSSAKKTFSDALAAAGGDAAARSKTAAFVAAWKELAKDVAFYQLQHAFVKTTYYDIFVAQTKTKIGLNINSKGLAVRNVAWSTAVQHGVNNSVFKNALSGLADPDDAAIINAVYDERSKVDKYFASSTAAVKQSVKNRFVDERADALQMLADQA